MIRKLAAALLATGLTAGVLLAQGPGGPPPDPQTMIARRVDFLTTLLNLSDAQKAQALTIFTDAAKAGQTVRTELQANHDSLRAAVKKNDTATIDALAIAAGTLSGQMTAIESKADAAFYAILTADQQAKYDAMPRGRGGPGGPGGPGMQRGRRGQ